MNFSNRELKQKYLPETVEKERLAARTPAEIGQEAARKSLNRSNGDNMTNIKMSRVWAMPSIWTFSIGPVKELLNRYHVGNNWADPFSGEKSPAEETNDIEGRGAKHQMDALDFLKTLNSSSFDGVLFDPPYSTEQCLRRYTPKHGGTAGRAEYWAKCKDEIARVTKHKAIVISFGWDSVGMGKNRGFTIIEILLICHGACHNDTIVTVSCKDE